MKPKDLLRLPIGEYTAKSKRFNTEYIYTIKRFNKRVDNSTSMIATIKEIDSANSISVFDTTPKQIVYKSDISKAQERLSFLCHAGDICIESNDWFRVLSHLELVPRSSFKEALTPNR